MSIPFPITRVDAEKREVEGVATFEMVEEDGKIFSYEASKEAFQAWVEHGGIVLEMFKFHRPIGKCVDVVFDDETKQATVRVRVSNGSQDTFTKVISGDLAEVGIAFTKPIWSKVEREGKEYPYLTKYDVTELSLIGKPPVEKQRPSE
jgi:hypothetical protein